MNIQLEKILPNPEQPRQVFNQVELEELAQSIRDNGIIQPIVVEEATDGIYILHDGERRWRAARLAGLAEIPAVTVPPLNGTGSQDRLVRALVANIQRSNLNPIEEARAFRKMQDDLGINPAQISRRLGIKEYKVYNRLVLLKLDAEIQELIAAGKLHSSKEIAYALLEIPTQARIRLAQGLAARGTSIRACIAACHRLKANLEAEAFVVEGPPAVELAQRRKGSIDRAKWDALHQLGAVPPWSGVVEAARKMCMSCSLSDVASENTCRECPGVELLGQLIEVTKKDGQHAR